MPSNERIELMDAILKAYLKSSTDRIDKSGFIKLHGLSRTDFEAAETGVLKFLQMSKFANVELFDDGSAAIAKWLDRSEANSFSNNGGFKSHYAEKGVKNNSINIIGDGNTVNQDSRLDNARQSPAIEINKTDTAKNKSARSWIEILSWIAAIIGAIIAIYEFFLKNYFRGG